MLACIPKVPPKREREAGLSCVSSFYVCRPFCKISRFVGLRALNSFEGGVVLKFVETELAAIVASVCVFDGRYHVCIFMRFESQTRRQTRRNT